MYVYMNIYMHIHVFLLFYIPSTFSCTVCWLVTGYIAVWHLQLSLSTCYCVIIVFNWNFAACLAYIRWLQNDRQKKWRKGGKGMWVRLTNSAWRIIIVGRQTNWDEHSFELCVLRSNTSPTTGLSFGESFDVINDISM